MNRQVPVHYLRPNHKVWTPGNVVFWDTETRQLVDGDRRIEQLRLWVARVVDRRKPKAGPPFDYEHPGRTGAELAEWLTEISRRRPSLWCFAYNLGFDLTTTRLPDHLADLGWHCTGAALSGRAIWLTFHRDGRSMTFADASSWLPGGLSEVAAAMGTAKLDLPTDLDDESTWFARCSVDVEILSDAMLALMDWWDARQLGRWWATGPTCGWNAYRHTPTGWRVTIDPDPELVAADREGIHGGRRGVWRVGEVRAGRLAELDFATAHLSIAEALPLPVERVHGFDTLPPHINLHDQSRLGVLARVLVETDTPRWPVKVRGFRFYPVGRFWTTLPGPDIEEAARLGCLVDVGPGHVHRMGFAMAEWARWVRAVLDGRDELAPAVARITAKHWGRTVIGRWAGHSWTRTVLGASPMPSWHIEAGWDAASQSPGALVDLGGTRWWTAADGDPENSYPAVLAWVEGYVRTRLNRVLEHIGPGAVVQCDTDGLIVNADLVGRRASRGAQIDGDDLDDAARMSAVLRDAETLAAPLRLREKRSWQRATVLGPQHVETPDYRRFAGLPRQAVRRDDGSFMGHIWPGMEWQMSNGDPRGYVRPMRRQVVEGPYALAWVLADGSVEPCRVILDAAGENYVLPWAAMPAHLRTRELAPRQHQALKGLW